MDKDGRGADRRGPRRDGKAEASPHAFQPGAVAREVALKRIVAKGLMELYGRFAQCRTGQA
ncbi:MAG: hypothetical protein ACT6RN_25415 [Agrobacterium sp.]